MKKLLTALRYARKRAKPEEILLVVLFALIAVGTIFFGSYIVKRGQFNRAAQGCFSSNAFGMMVRREETLDVSELLCEYVRENPGVTVNRYFGGIRKFSTVFAECAYVPDVVSGRYFTAADFSGGKTVCVVGTAYSPPDQSTIEERTVTENGVKYVIYAGVKYEVIGTVGYKLESFANNVLILNLDAAPCEVKKTSGNPFVIDAPTARLANKARAELKSKLEALGCTVTLTEIPVDSMSVSDFFNMGMLNLIMILFGAFAVVLATVPLTLLWSARRRKNVAVKRLLGFSLPFTLAQMLGRLMVLFHIGFFAGFLLYNIIAKIWYLGVKSFFSPTMLVAYLGALAFNLLIAIVPFVQTVRVDPGDALRRE